MIDKEVANMFDTYLGRAEIMFNTISGQQNTGVDDLPLLISATMAAKTLGISPRNLWTQTQSGTIPFIKIGRRVMYSPSSLQDWVARNTIIGGDKNGESLQG